MGLSQRLPGLSLYGECRGMRADFREVARQERGGPEGRRKRIHDLPFTWASWTRPRARALSRGVRERDYVALCAALRRVTACAASWTLRRACASLRSATLLDLIGGATSMTRWDGATRGRVEPRASESPSREVAPTKHAHLRWASMFAATRGQRFCRAARRGHDAAPHRSAARAHAPSLKPSCKTQSRAALPALGTVTYRQDLAVRRMSSACGQACFLSAAHGTIAAMLTLMLSRTAPRTARCRLSGGDSSRSLAQTCSRHGYAPSAELRWCVFSD